jgi:DNA-binding transcriptional LysR family regulator
MRNAAGEQMAVPLKETVAFDDPEAMCHAAVLGLGVAQIAMAHALRHLESGALVLMSPNHRLARRKALEVDELAGERLLLPGRQFLTRQWFDAACRRGNLRPIVALESTMPHALVALARVDYGIAIVPSHTPFDHRELRGARLTQRGTMLGAWAAIAWERHRFQPPFVERFVEELVRHARRAYPSSEVAGRNALKSMSIQ